MNYFIKIFVLSFVVSGLFSCKENNVKNETEFKWMDIKEGLAYQNTSNKKYIVQIEADSCKWCKIMDEKTYSYKPLTDYLKENYINIKFDTKYADTLEFKGEKFGTTTIGLLKIHALADKWLNFWYNYPTTVIMDKDMNVITKFSGYKDPDQFLLELKNM
jgi:thioredoxin-related protein